MIEIIAAVAGLLGVSAKDLTKAVTDVRDRKSKEKIERRREKESIYANQKNITEVLTRYYEASSVSGNLSRYSAIIDGAILDTTIFTSEKYLSLFEDPRDMSVFLTDHSLTSSNQQIIPQAVVDYAPEAIERLESMGVKLWNQHLYRLLKISNDSNLSLTFSLTDFFSYRFTSGFLGDELIDALVVLEGSTDKIFTNPQVHLPIRAAIMPDLAYIDDFYTRICAGGIGVLLAIARGAPYDDFLIPLQVRSSSVSDGRNQLAVLPKAFHQPVVGSGEEVGLYCTLLREVFEEVYGHPEVEHESPKIKHDWYIDEEPGVAYLRDHLGAYSLEVLGFALNAVAGNYDFGMLLAIRDTWYWNTFGSKLAKNWEAKNLILISSRDEARIKDILTGYNWANESIPHVVEGLLRLKQIEPKKVKLPDIQRSLVS